MILKVCLPSPDICLEILWNEPIEFVKIMLNDTNTRWALGIISNLVALDCPDVICNTPGMIERNLHSGSRAHPGQGSGRANTWASRRLGRRVAVRAGAQDLRRRPQDNLPARGSQKGERETRIRAGGRRTRARRFVHVTKGFRFSGLWGAVQHFPGSQAHGQPQRRAGRADGLPKGGGWMGFRLGVEFGVEGRARRVPMLRIHRSKNVESRFGGNPIRSGEIRSLINENLLESNL